MCIGLALSFMSFNTFMQRKATSAARLSHLDTQTRKDKGPSRDKDLNTEYTVVSWSISCNEKGLTLKR